MSTLFLFIFAKNFELIIKYNKMNFLTFFLGFMPGGGEWIVIGLGVLLLFGGKKIPELMKGLGSGIKEFKNAAKDDQPANKKEEETKE